MNNADSAGGHLTKLSVTSPQKDIIYNYFKSDLELIAKYTKMISTNPDKEFKYLVFKDYIYAAAGMMREVDFDFYKEKLTPAFKVIKSLDDLYLEFRAKSKHVLTVYVTEFLAWQEDYVALKKEFEDLKEELQMLIGSDKKYASELKKINIRVKELEKQGTLDDMSDSEKEKIKTLRREHVDVIHLLGERRKRLALLQDILSNFEEEHKSLFMDYFKKMKLNIDSKYITLLNYFGFKFNTKLFKEAKKSAEIQKFKTEAAIFGDLSLCKYVDYHLKNLQADNLSDENKKKNLMAAKMYCKNKRERENLF